MIRSHQSLTDPSHGPGPRQTLKTDYSFLIFSRLCLSTITADEYFKRIHRIVSLLDTENVQIIRTMKEFGPRNLRQLSKRAALPYPTVHARVRKLEEQGTLRTWVHPNYRKIDLVKIMVLATPVIGKESLAGQALKIPGFWIRFTRCIGDCNGFYSLHAVPIGAKQDFEHYLDRLTASGLIRNYRLFSLDETYSPIPNFDYYDLRTKTWRFDWKHWAQLPQRKRKEREAATPNSREHFDKRDLIILKELVKDARVTLADITKILQITLPATKYRFDSLVNRGFIHDYVINILPFAPEVSDLLEVRLDGKNEDSMEAIKGRLTTMPFVLSYSPIISLNSATLRIYIPRSERGNFFAFLADLARDNALLGYSYYLLDPMSIQAQTFAYKDYDDTDGWHFKTRDYISALESLLSKGSPKEDESFVFTQAPTGLIQVN